MRFAGFKTLDVDNIELKLVRYPRNLPICDYCWAVRPEMFEIADHEDAPPNWACSQCVQAQEHLFVLIEHTWYQCLAKILLHDAFVYGINVKCACDWVVELRNLPNHRLRCPLRPAPTKDAYNI